MIKFNEIKKGDFLIADNDGDRKIGEEDLHQAVHEQYPGDACYTAGDREHGGCRSQ